MPGLAAPGHATPRQAAPCRAMPGLAAPRLALPRHAAPRLATLQHQPSNGKESVMSDATIPATIEAIGITPLVMANGAMAAADNEFSIQFAEIVSKGSKMTRDDRHNKDLLQWRGDVFESGGRPVIPPTNPNP